MYAARQDPRPTGSKGFTLIELVVALAIMLMVITLVTVAVGNIRRADLKASSGTMAAAMRYLYNLAVINNTPYRLVIDMDKGAFWGEELQTDDPCARYLPEEGEEVVGESGEEADEEAKEAEEAREDEEGGDRRGRMDYQRRKDNLLSERKLPRGIQVTGVMTVHHSAAQHDGRAAIHFFPGGYAEHAFIWLGERDRPDEDADPMVTLELDGLMGRVTRHRNALDESEFVRESE